MHSALASWSISQYTHRTIIGPVIMGIVGNLRTMQLEELLQWLSQSKKNGTLEIVHGKTEKKVFFKDGLILSSASNKPEEYLGHFLVSHGLINEAQLNRAIELQEKSRTLLGMILVKNGAIAERDLRSAQQAADAAQARLVAADARLRVAANLVRDTRVVAPFGGTIEKRKVQSGENTARGAEMFTLVRNEILELTASVPARRANEVRAGQPVRFSADGRQFSGKVARMSPTIDPASRSITVYVQIPNAKGELKGNTFATGQIIAQTLTGALVVPQTAIRAAADGGKPYVYRIEGGELAVASVRLGLADDARGTVEVKDGLNEQDDIVVGTPGTLGRGMKVQIIGNEGRGGRGADARGGNRGKKIASP